MNGTFYKYRLLSGGIFCVIVGLVVLLVHLSAATTVAAVALIVLGAAGTVWGVTLMRRPGG